MAGTVLEHYKGAGIVYIAEVGGALIDMGTVDDVSISSEEETANLRNPRTGEGNIASQSRLSGLTLEMSLFTFNSSNLAVALRGTVTAADDTPITDEALDVPAALTGNPMIPTARIIDTTVDPVVSATGGGTERVIGTDYTVTPAGIIAIEGGGLVAGDTIDYTPKAGDVLESFVNSGKEYRIFIDGINNVENDKPYRIDCYKWKPAPSSDFSIISDDDYASTPLSGELIADATKGTGKSQYFKRERVA